MEKPEKFKLIDGQFNPSDAKSILFTLINSKINFHSLESFGITVRSSGDTSLHDKRILELKAANANIKKMLDYAQQNNLRVNIDSNIEIELVNVPKNTSK